MRHLSLTARTALWFVGVAALLLAVFSVASWIAVRTAMLESLDEQLAARAQAIIALCEWDRGQVECEATPEIAARLGAGPDAGIALWTLPDREPLLVEGAPVAAAAIPAQPPLRTQLDSVGDWRVRAAFAAIANHRDDPPAPPDAGVLVVTTASLAPVRARLRELGLTLAIEGIACLLLAIGLGAFVSRRVVDPLRALGAAARRVADGREAAVPRRGTGDEIDRLADVLDVAFASQRAALERQARFTADAAHELRNPIASIRTSAEVAQRAERTPAERAGFLDDIARTAARMGATVEALLELARLDAGAQPLRTEDCDLSGLARELAASIGDGIDVRGEPVHVRGDRRLLGILIGNLLHNAVRFRVSRVAVDVRRDPDGTAELTVTDDGPGARVADPQALFERFRRREPSPAGAGLGLAIVAEIAHAHGGDARFLDVAQGAAVRVRLPAT
ncbi:MAG: hypothetical protein IPM29_21665 [Planctomycetes bacterium]|nr:hypothetical protein [Planctomycetota bacterium]